MNYIEKINARWNMLDSVIYILESKTSQLISDIKESKDTLPNPEEMIEAETQYLKSENEKLKSLHFPKKIEKAAGSKNYICPNKKCSVEISDILIEQYKIKYCPECGQRIYYLPETKNYYKESS